MKLIHHKSTILIHCNCTCNLLIFFSDVFYGNEVIDLGGEAIGVGDYLHLGRITEFKYCNFMGQAFRKHFSLRDLRTIGESWGMMADGSAFVFVDNHDNQRGHGAGGDIILTYKVIELNCS